MIPPLCQGCHEPVEVMTGVARHKDGSLFWWHRDCHFNSLRKAQDVQVGRNDTCLCGSGRKVKKCHPDAVGLKVSTIRPILETLAAVESLPGHVPPPDGLDGWSVRNYRQHGCPYGDGVCDRQTDYGGTCAAGCGV